MAQKHTRARLSFDQSELEYDFGAYHPLQPRRIVALLDLLESSKLWRRDDPQQNLPPRAASIEELELVHTPDYIAAVQRLSTRSELPEDLDAQKYGFGDSDTPPMPRMHDVSAMIAGGTLVALSAVMGLPEGGTFSDEDERPLHVFHPSGGLHHAWPARASGFCVYNDAAVAIAHLLRATEARVLYVDFDGHHGDGVQRAFYDDPRVMTVSFHETGRYLFPGTGDVLEMGQGQGRGYSVNVPLEPFTEDSSFYEVISALLPPLVLSFAPDVIVSQHGCDSHDWDPLTHLALTMRSMRAQAKLVHDLTHQYCQGRWVALGGGGYALYRVVPRAWSIVWAEMSGQTLPEQLPEDWVARWRPAWEATEAQELLGEEVLDKGTSSLTFPTTFQDRAQDFPIQPRRWTINETNRQTAALARQLLIPPPVRQAFPALKRQSALSGMVDLLHLGGSSSLSRTELLETSQGPLLLRNFCPPSVLERLRPDKGLQAFTRFPEREQQLLLSIAKSPDCALTVAHTPTGKVVGEVTLAPGEGWWEGLDNVFEVTIEVSSHWRGLRLAQKILAFSLELPAIEDMILFAMGLSWHWDIEDLGLSIYRYRQLIASLFGSQRFVEYETKEPNINEAPSNILMVRIGKDVDESVKNRFLRHL